MIARNLLEEIQNLRKTLDTLLARDEPTVHSYDERHNAKSGSTGRDDPFISRNVFERRPRCGMTSLPVVTEAGFLQHGEQFIVRQLPG